MAVTDLISLREIIPSEVESMGRRRGQRCPVHKGPNGFFFRYRVDSIDGKRHEKTKYLPGVKGIREAEKLRDEFLAAAINRPEVLLPSQTVFGVVLDKFVESMGLRHSSECNYRAVVRKHIRPRWGDVRMCDIQQMDVEAWIGGASKDIGIQQFKKVKTVFRAAWLAAIRWGYTRQAEPISLMPANIGRPRPTEREHALPTEAQINQILAFLKGPKRLMAQIMMFTGLRAGEALALRWSDVETDVLTVRRAMDQHSGTVTDDVKTPQSRRRVPIKHIRGMLVRPASAAREDLIWPGAKYEKLQFSVKRAAKAVGCDYDGFGCHMFRRWHNTEFRRAGGSVELAMGQLGHGSRDVNDRYMIAGEAELDARAKVAATLIEKVRVM